MQGFILNDKDKTPQIGVIVFLIRTLDSLKSGAVTDFEGRFLIQNIQPGAYTFTTSYVGYLAAEKALNIDTADVDLGSVLISQNGNLLKEVLVVGKQIRVQQHQRRSGHQQ